MTPHPGMGRRGKPERIVPHPHYGVPNQTNGVKTDSLGGGDPLGSKTLSGFQDGSDIALPKAISHNSFRGSRLSVRPSLEGINSPEKISHNRNGDVSIGDSLNRRKTNSSENHHEMLNGDKSPLLVVANGTDTTNSNQQKY